MKALGAHLAALERPRRDGAGRAKVHAVQAVGRLDAHLWQPRRDFDGRRQRIYKQLDKFHPQPANAKTANARDLVALPEPSALQGGKLVSSELGPKLEDQIIDFLSVHVTKQDWPWIKRRNTIQ